MMSRGFVYLLLLDQAGTVLWLFCGFYVVALIRVGSGPHCFGHDGKH
jgi:hypothetical protein